MTKVKKLKFSQILIIATIIGFVLPTFAFCQSQAPTVEMPKTLEEAKVIGQRVLGLLPMVLKGVLVEAGSIWNSYVLPNLKWCLKKVEIFLGKEIKKRKPTFEEEFKKEKEEAKEELKTEAPKIGKDLWERFIGLFKD